MMDRKEIVAMATDVISEWWPKYMGDPDPNGPQWRKEIMFSDEDAGHVRIRLTNQDNVSMVREYIIVVNAVDVAEGIM